MADIAQVSTIDLESLTWEQISQLEPTEDMIGLSKSLTMTQTWNIGPSYHGNLSGTVTIVGINHDEKTDGTGKAKFTFRFDWIPVKNLMRSPASKDGGYADAANMRSFLDDTFFNGLPEDLKPYVVQVNKPSCPDYTNPAVNVPAYVWPFSLCEQHGPLFTNAQEQEGPQYAWYASATTSDYQNLDFNATQSGYWLRSVRRTEATSYFLSRTTGAASNSREGVAPGFCIDGETPDYNNPVQIDSLPEGESRTISFSHKVTSGDESGLIIATDVSGLHVTARRELPVEVEFPFDKSFENCTWEELATRYEPTEADIGKTKTITFGNGTLTDTDTSGTYVYSGDVRVIGINHDDRTDGNGKAKFTFGFAFTPLRILFNSTPSNAGGYAASDRLRPYLDGTFFNAFPDELRSVIISVEKPTRAVSTAEATNISCKVWPLSANEIFGSSNIYSYADEGEQYQWFVSGGTRVVSSQPYWLRSISSGTTLCFEKISNTGLLTRNDATNWSNAYGYVAPGFCIG